MKEPIKDTTKLIWAALYVDDLVQDCSISIANALEILQSCTEPLMCSEPPTWAHFNIKSIFPGIEIPTKKIGVRVSTFLCDVSIKI